MRFLTSLLPLITLALRVAGTDPSPGSNPIPLTHMSHQYPEPAHAAHPNGNGYDTYHPDVEAANLGAHRQQSPCRNCLEKAKGIVAASVKAPVNALGVVVCSSLNAIITHPIVSLLGCVLVGNAVLLIYCMVGDNENEWCHHLLSKRNIYRRDSGYPTCQRLECGDDVCGVPQTVIYIQLGC
ncbi:hypothetical protein F5879DRAFT_980957 [Lentinula edodes]|nr:hypothetical protein F5879DRAFT_980957 [Lentinula edodes]